VMAMVGGKVHVMVNGEGVKVGNYVGGVGVGGIGVSRQKQKYDRIQNSRRTDSKLKSLTNSSVCLFSPMTIGYDGQTNGVLTFYCM
jgi:hypothetical protein